MRPKLEYFRMGLRLLYEWLFSILLAYFFLIIFVKKTPFQFIELILLGVYLVSYLTRRKAPNNFVAFLIHIVCGTAMFFLPIPRGDAIVIAMIIFYQLWESFIYIRTGKLLILNDVPWPTLLISIIIYAYGYFTHSSLLTTWAYYIPIMLIVIYFLIIYLDGMNKYVESTRDVTGLPISRIVKTNSLIVFVILALLITGILLGNWLDLDAALYKLGRGILSVIGMIVLVIRIIGRIIYSIFHTESNEEILSEENEFGDIAGLYARQIRDSSEFVFKLIAVIFVIYILYKFLSWFIRLLMKKRQINGDIIEKADMRIRSIVNYNSINKNNTGSSREEKLRKLYRESIIFYRYDIRLSQNKTPQEIEKELYDMEIADVREITDIYRDVRYGGENVTKEMLRAFKK
ncbi:MAG: DUF4129 domain-containing protein [Lachnospiraceae bacterium]|nr:DUF4129 domain-containing protein [Lachnospiraceae bacterium]